MAHIKTWALAAALSAFAASAGAEQTSSISSAAKPGGKLATQTEVIAERGEQAMITLGSNRAMELAVALYEDIIAAGGWPPLPNERLKKGDNDRAVILLRQRLAAEGYLKGEQAEVMKPKLFDADVVAALKAFQITHGLPAGGKLDGASIAELNVSAEERLATLRANQPRVETYLKGLGVRNILVNIPSAQLEAVNYGTVYSRHNVVVGKIARPSPSVTSKITEINFNPYWNAPVSIVGKDLIPKLLKDPEAMRKMRIRVFDGFKGPEIDTAAVDWANTSADRYFFRQDPGGDNAMASLKINYANPFNVYLHDTPMKSLFQQNARYESSGCVRVDQVHVLVDWILNGQDGMDHALIQEIAASEERLDVRVRNAPDIRLMYLTAWATEDGHVHFRPDIYYLDGTGFITGQPVHPSSEAAVELELAADPKQ